MSARADSLHFSFWILKMLVKQVSVSLVYCPRDDILKRIHQQLPITFRLFLVATVVLIKHIFGFLGLQVFAVLDAVVAVLKHFLHRLLVVHI